MADSSAQRDPQTYAIIGACMEVHRELGHGFLETVYQEALAIEFGERRIACERERGLPISYKGQRLNCSYKADFVCYGEIVVEIKSVARLVGPHEAQLINYLKASGMERGLLINFGAPSLEHRRLICTHNNLSSRRDHEAVP